MRLEFVSIELFFDDIMDGCVCSVEQVLFCILC